jgi:hypothetical protein
LEVTGSCWEVARILEPHVNRVIVVSPDDTGISSARSTIDTVTAPDGPPPSISSLRGGPQAHATLFDFEVPGGKWQTVMESPVSAPRRPISTFDSRKR